LVVRVKLRVIDKAGQVELPALVNSGFEADGPQLIPPVEVAEGAWLAGGGQKPNIEGSAVALGDRVKQAPGPIGEEPTQELTVALSARCGGLSGEGANTGWWLRQEA